MTSDDEKCLICQNWGCILVMPLRGSWHESRIAEGGELEYPEKNPQSQIKIDNSQPTCRVQALILGRRGGRLD